MIYFVKFIYQIFLMPAGMMVLALSVLSYRLYKTNEKKLSRILAATAVAFYLASTTLVGGSLVRIVESKYTPPVQPAGDVIIMLGGGATLDTPNLDGQGHLSGSAANRLLACLQLYNRLKIPIIISGGQVFENTGTEAHIAKNILGQLGVPQDKILVEDKSLNTTQNARNTKELVMKMGFKRPIVVTSAFHMDRAVRQFKKVNLEVAAFPTGYLTNINHRFNSQDFLPSSEGLDKTSTALKELVGILASRWY